MNLFNGAERQEFPQHLYSKQPFPVSEYVCHSDTGPVHINKHPIGIHRETYTTPVQTRSPVTNIIFGTLGNDDGWLPPDNFARFGYGKNYYGHSVNAFPGRYAVADDETFAFVREPEDMAPKIYYSGLYVNSCGSDFPKYGNAPATLAKRAEKQRLLEK